MANEEHLKILKQGVEAWNEWREENADVQPDLSRAYLIGAKLSGAKLGRANLFDVNLCRADLSETDLSGADLRWAYLHEADLSDAILREADLRLAKLSNAILREADLRGAILRETDISEARIGWTTFGDVDLSAVKGLETVSHDGPSTIGIDTIYRSKGNIPEVFLRRAGVPDDLIDYMASLVSKPYYSCMVCYSDEDRDFSDRLYADLWANGVRAWYFRKDARWGEPGWGEIDRSIKKYDKVVVICSENSLQSGPVLREIERALQREDREGKNILFPIRIDDYVFDRWEHPRKADVVSKVVGDFRGWEQNADKYETAFEKLLEALEAEG